LLQLDAIHCNVQTRASLARALADTGWLVERMWLQNDFTSTSSVFHRLPAGLTKRVLGRFIDGAVGHPAVATAARVLGAEEYVRPSIYALCRPAPVTAP
jgi:hypothetical protein